MAIPRLRKVLRMAAVIYLVADRSSILHPKQSARRLRQLILTHLWVYLTPYVNAVRRRLLVAPQTLELEIHP